MNDIEGYEGIYAITEDGRVWSHARIRSAKSNQPIGGRFLKLHVVAANRRNHGYQYVDLYKNCKRKKVYVHQLVAKAFIPNPLELPEVNHLNYVRDNNRVENLEWISKKGNVVHGLLKRNTARGKRHGAYKHGLYTDYKRPNTSELASLSS